MATQRTIVTLETDGSRDYVRLPTGVRYILGTTSVLKLVSQLVSDRAMRRKALDDFNSKGQAVVTLDVNEMLAFLAPRPVRRASLASSFMHAHQQTPPGTKGNDMADQTKMLDMRLAHLENTIREMDRHVGAGQRVPVALASNLRRAAITLPDFGDQSKNKAWYGLGEPEVDTVGDEGWTPPAEVTHPMGKAARAKRADEAVEAFSDLDMGEMDLMDEPVAALPLESLLVAVQAAKRVGPAKLRMLARRMVEVLSAISSLDAQMGLGQDTLLARVTKEFVAASRQEPELVGGDEKLSPEMAIEEALAHMLMEAKKALQAYQQGNERRTTRAVSGIVSGLMTIAEQFGFATTPMLQRVWKAFYTAHGMEMAPEMGHQMMASGKAEMSVAESILVKLAETTDLVESLQGEGRQFNAAKAQADLHRIATDVHALLSETDLTDATTGAALNKLASQTDRIHGLFKSAANK